jgi:AcrR family transcriptional regulator
MSARQRLIESTIALIRCRGVENATVSEILEHSGLARRTLYLNFPDGKPGLLAAAIESAAASFTDQLSGLLEGGDPADVVVAFAKAWETALADSDYSAGCPMVAAVLAGEQTANATSAAALALAGWVEAIASVFTDRGLDRSDAEELATTVVAAVEGAVIMSMAARSAAPLQRVGRQLADVTRLKFGDRATSRPG